jgi:hypothetical protein
MRSVNGLRDASCRSGSVHVDGIVEERRELPRYAASSASLTRGARAREREREGGLFAPTILDYRPI